MSWGIETRSDGIVEERLRRWPEAIGVSLLWFLREFSVRAIRMTPVDTGELIRSSEYSQLRLGKTASSVLFRQTDGKASMVHALSQTEGYNIKQVKNPSAEEEWIHKAEKKAATSPVIKAVAAMAWQAIEGNKTTSGAKRDVENAIKSTVVAHDGS